MNVRNSIHRHVVGLLACGLLSTWLTFHDANADERDLLPRAANFSYDEMASGPWRNRPVQGRPFWFTLGGAEDSAVHNATIEAKQIADHGLHHYGIGEWEYSFHHIKPGQADGAGYIHNGGYPTPPKSRAEAAAVVRAYYAKMAEDARAKATPEQLPLFASFNGHHCYQHYACEWGCDIVGSEVGENINGIQAHIAFTRGAARQYDKPWMIDFSSWYGPSMYDEDPKKHWGEYSGPDRGHSLSLHLRTYYVAYMAGAEIVVAEAGWLNFFRSQEPGADGLLPLSRLGEKGAEFYQFTKRHPVRGIPYTPFAILADFYHGIFPGFGEKLSWNAFPYTKGDQRILDLWNAFFPSSIDVQSKHDEKGYLVASPYGDVVDVLLTNAPEAVLNAYPVVLLAGELTDVVELAPKLCAYVRQGGTLVLSEDDAQRPEIAEALRPRAIGSDNGYSTRRAGRGAVIVYAENGTGKVTPLAAVLTKLSTELIPFEVSGNVETLYNRTSDGWIMTIVNNDGITKSFNDAPNVDASAAQSVDIRFTGKGRVIGAVVWGLERDESRSTDVIRLDIPPGEVRVVQFRLQSR